MTVGEVGNFTRAFYPRWNKTLYEQVIDHFGLCESKNMADSHAVSRVCFALPRRSHLIPSCWILDDPTLGLDTVVRRNFWSRWIQLIPAARSYGVVFSSRTSGDVERAANHVGIMIDGVLRVDCLTDTCESIRKVVAEFQQQPPDFQNARVWSIGGRSGRSSSWSFVGWGPEQEALVQSLVAAGSMSLR